MNDRMRPLIAASALLISVLIVFGASLKHGFAPIDDAYLIVENIAIRGVNLETLRLIFTTFDPELYNPLTLFSFQLNYLLGGLHPFGYHLVNLLLHAGNALLVVWFSARLRAPVRNIPKTFFAPLLLGAIFALHPIQTESVVWLSMRKELLMTLFFLSSLVGYLHYVGAPLRGVRAWRPLTFSVVFFLFALLSKVTAAVLPIVLLFYDVLVEKREFGWPILREKLPYVFLSVVFLIVAFLGKGRVVTSLSIAEAALLSTKSTAMTLQHVIFPVGLRPIYEQTTPIVISAPEFFVSFLVILVIVVSLVVLVYRYSIQHSVAGGTSFGFLFFLFTLAPTFFSFRKGSFVFFAADHYAYLPSIGLFLVFITVFGALRPTSPSQPAGQAWLRETGATPLRRTCTIAASAILVAVLAILSFNQTRVWENPEALYSHILRHQPDSVAARTGYASVLRSGGRYEEAFKILRQGLRFGSHPQLHLHAGIVYAGIGRTEDAREQFTIVRSADPMNPEPVLYLGVLSEHKGDVGGAIALYEQAVALDPSYVAARVSLGKLLRAQGLRNEAEEQFREALRWNPSAGEARRELLTE